LTNLESLEKEIQKKGLASVYLILGSEPYHCNLAIQMLKANAVPAEAEAFDYSDVSAGDLPVEEIIRAADTFPMISPKRMTLIRAVDKLRDFECDLLLDSLKRVSSRIVLVLYAADLDRRKRFYKTLRGNHCVVELITGYPHPE
jgi:DNA polymerase III delta subunit